ncbi:glycoside hydrolase family 6 protein [Microtetraspora malaysiensis]|uniref:glycoside hydrolase family 6 protein n=1 Tax=Microtetraspora malaysiensis TaxID=161358 RepID=UPI003D92A7B9
MASNGGNPDESPIGDALREGDPRQVGPFALLRRLGQGGMGTVYLGRAPGGDPVAIKLIHPQWAADPDFRRRFTREISAAQRVARFCTAPVLAADVEGDTAYLVTEYVPGPTLQQAVRDHGPLSGSHLESVAVSVAVALQAIHAAGIVHRDLKPGNVLLSPLGPKVIDFGIAQLAEAGAHVSSAIVGTPAYMPPEQARGEHVTPASDIFAWGALVAYAASGHAPFGDGPPPSVLYRIVHHEPDLTTLEPHLRATVAHALAKDPAHRPTAQQLLDALTRRTPAGQAPYVRDSAEPVETSGTHETGGTGSTASTGGTADEGTVVARRRTGVLAGAAAAAVALLTAGVVVALRIGAAGGDDGSPGQAITSRSASAPPAATAAASPSAAGGGTGGESDDVKNNAKDDTTGDTTDDANDGAKDGNPLTGRAVRLYVSPDGDPARQASAWQAAGRHGDAALMRALARVPRSVWLEARMTDADAARIVNTALDAAGKQGAVPVFVTDRLPLRDCYPNGAPDSRAYASWIGAIATAIGDRPAVVVLEPNSLSKVPGTPGCALGGPNGEQTRYDQLSSAVKRLGALPRTAVYLDGGQRYWPSIEDAASRLIKAGLDQADGFFLNASGFQPTDTVEAYGVRLAKCVHLTKTGGGSRCLGPEVDAVPDDTPGLPHFVIDTGRNGRGGWRPPAKKYKQAQEWCNPPGRGLGPRPATDTASGLADAYLWIRDPTKSNGTCTRGTSGPEDPVYGLVAPRGGEFWPDLALQRAKDAVPPLS